MSKTNQHSYGYLSDKEKLFSRLSRIEGQVQGVKRMVEDERYCIDILTQISAIDAALQVVALNILDGHVRSCVSQAMTSRNPEGAKLKTNELLEAVNRFARAK